MGYSLKERINLNFKEASDAMERKDYILAEEKYHILSHLCLALMTESQNESDRKEYQSLMNEYLNKESYVKRLLEGDKKLEGIKSQVCFSDFVGEKWIKKSLESEIISYWKENKLNEREKNGVLIYGPFGVGKTTLVEALANELNASIFPLGPLKDFQMNNFPDAVNRVQNVLDSAKEKDNSIIFLEDPLCYFPKGEEGSVSKEISDLFLEVFRKEMRKIKRKNKRVLFFATTDCPDKLDPRVFQNGLFDYLLEMTLPDKETRFALIKKDTKGLSDDFITDFVELTEGYTSWQITRLAKEVMEKSIGTKTDFLLLLQQEKKEFDEGYFEHLNEFKSKLK